jgi:hypothetical protein
MADELEKKEANEEEKPEIFSVKKGEEGFSYSRRDFLVTAAAGTAAIAAIGAGIDALTPDGKPAGSAAGDESKAVKLEVEALGMIVLPLARGIEHAWKISNQGQNPSPQAVLRLTAAHELQQDFTVPALAPGQSVEVPVSLAAPGTAGEYRYQWQLRLGDSDARLNEFIVKVTDVTLAESQHPYLNSTDQTWTINNPDPGAVSSYIHFTRVETEASFDYIYIMDGPGTVIQTLNGNYPNGLWSNKVNGAVVKVRLTTDSSMTYWGFQVDAIITSFIFTYLPMIRRAPPTPTSYVVCSCNTVDVCVCNLVCVCEAVCSCDGYCSCDTVCSCDGDCSCNQVCTCDSVHYWYPN